VATLPIRDTLARHWPEYLVEAWALGMFMVAAGLVTVAVESPRSPVPRLVVDPDIRRLIIGLAMGCTAVLLIYSPWGKRSGAHMNPAVTLSFLLLGKIRGLDALCYCVAQLLGGVAGVLLAWAIAGTAFSAPEVNFVATLPGTMGARVAFVAELGISMLLMLTVLTASSRPRTAPYTGICAGVLVAAFITFEAPLSGMSMNPARSLASAAPAGVWHHLWIYCTAPVIGMTAAAVLWRRANGRGAVPCAKLQHPTNVRCIHCGYEPPRAAPLAAPGWRGSATRTGASQ
jgi:aquaporin Z